MFTTKTRGREVPKQNFSHFVLFVLQGESDPSDFAPFAVKFFYSSTTEISDFTPLRFNSSKNIR